MQYNENTIHTQNFCGGSSNRKVGCDVVENYEAHRISGLTLKNRYTSCCTLSGHQFMGAVGVATTVICRRNALQTMVIPHSVSPHCLRRGLKEWAETTVMSPPSFGMQGQGGQ